MFTLSASLNFDIWSQYVITAYIHGRNLSCNFYFKPPQNPTSIRPLFKLLKPVYGLSESGEAWFQRFKDYKKTLKSNQQTETCLSTAIDKIST